MVISLVDAIIILLILMGGIVGYKNGAIKEGMQFIGMLFVVVVSFLLKDSLMVLLYENLPFFNFFGFIRGISAINILFYQLVAFLIIFLALTFILKVLIVITGFIEWMLRITIFLKIPSNILGIVVVFLEFYVYVFIILYVLNMPVFNLSYVAESKYGDAILNNTPILSGMVDDTVKAYTDVWKIIENKDDMTNTEINTLVLVKLLDNKLITVDSAKRLVNSNKIIITDKTILDNYSDDKYFYKEILRRYKENEQDL